MSKSFGLQIPKSLHKQTERCATRDGVSVEEFCQMAIAVRVGAEAAAEESLKQFAGKVILSVD